MERLGLFRKEQDERSRIPDTNTVKFSMAGRNIPAFASFQSIFRAG